jgi:cell division protein FtsI (penicillin-binding protein 3)
VNPFSPYGDAPGTPAGPPASRPAPRTPGTATPRPGRANPTLTDRSGTASGASIRPAVPGRSARPEPAPAPPVEAATGTTGPLAPTRPTTGSGPAGSAPASSGSARLSAAGRLSSGAAGSGRAAVGGPGVSAPAPGRLSAGGTGAGSGRAAAGRPGTSSGSVAGRLTAGGPATGSGQAGASAAGRAAAGGDGVRSGSGPSSSGRPPAGGRGSDAGRSGARSAGAPAGGPSARATANHASSRAGTAAAGGRPAGATSRAASPRSASRSGAAAGRATTARTTAGAPRTAAGTGRTATGTARTAAGTARTAASTAMTAAGTARTAAGTARTAAGTPRTAAGTGRTAAGTARTGTPRSVNGTARTSTGTAGTGTPRTATGTRRTAAGTARTAAGTARTAVGTASGAARTTARTARTATGGARTAAGAARTATRGTARRAPARSGGGGRPPRRPARVRLMRLGDPGRRLAVGFAAVCTLLVILGGRLVQLQGFDSEHLAAKAAERLLFPSTIPALRGRIVDRDGRALAYSVASRTIYADPTEIEDPAATAARLAPFLRATPAELTPKLAKEGTRYVPLATGVTPQAAETIIGLDLRGIGSADSTQRVYPGNDLAASVIGYTNADGGLAGIESKFDGTLKGTPGRLEVERGSNGMQIPGGLRQETAAVPGSTVQLTLDEDLQFMAQRALVEAVKKSQAAGGQVVVLDAKTGEVLAMASVPTFDAQNPARSDPARRANPAVQAPIEPGSANKLVTFAGALDRNRIRPETILTVPDSIKVADRYVHDAWSHEPQKFTATGVLAKSSNVGTLLVADKLLGPRQFYDYERAFGIGEKSGIELPGESGGILPAPETWSGTTFGNLPIGQGLSMTPLQLAGMYQAIANDGVRIQPRIVKGVIAPDGTVTPTTPAARTTVVSPQAARTVRTMLEAVVGPGGTAPGAKIDNYRVAGKTGTAQKPDPTCRCYRGGYWATFAGIAPADDPELVMSVVIDEAKGGGHGGAVAGPLFRDVMSYALTARKVTPTGTPAPTPRLIVD